MRGRYGLRRIAKDRQIKIPLAFNSFKLFSSLHIQQRAIQLHMTIIVIQTPTSLFHPCSTIKRLHLNAPERLIRKQTLS